MGCGPGRRGAVEHHGDGDEGPHQPQQRPDPGGGGGAARSPLSRPMRGRHQKPAPHRGGPQSNRMPPPMRPRLPPGGGSRSSPFPLAPFSLPSPLPRRPLTSLSVEEGGTRRRIRSPLGASGHGAFSQDPRRSVSTLLRNPIYWEWRWEGTTPPPNVPSHRCLAGVFTAFPDTCRSAPRGHQRSDRGHRVGAKRGGGAAHRWGVCWTKAHLWFTVQIPGRALPPRGGPWTAPFASAP